jgi:hypothetical protein
MLGRRISRREFSEQTKFWIILIMGQFFYQRKPNAGPGNFPAAKFGANKVLDHFDYGSIFFLTQAKCWAAEFSRCKFSEQIKLWIILIIA